ncbi:hypothetical protein F4553_002502 [Allocatelliglobosispora scoriae]|uniref:Uncharacterized protein n=1 Tax=Allocatelliglobosispora scoriae TaxID=643052 RepID=A0A841BQA8_9ACTN|nr:hypothetical protein [Allocatelliglobosispora scoriae]MBB5869123.1 hypothetical protein [Allocatelliglobosispora scoriae]
MAEQTGTAERERDGTAERRGTRAFDVAADVAKHLVTLSAAIVALTITFSTEILAGQVSDAERLIAGVAWGLYFISILGGVWLLYAVSGSVDAIERGTSRSIYDANTAIPMGVQQVSFVLALLATVLFGFVSI